MNNYDYDNIGKFISERRKNKGLTQNRLAEKLNTSFKTISKWENGHGFPDLLYQRLLCKELGITLDELHNGVLNIKQRKIHTIHKVLLIVLSILFVILTPLVICYGSFYHKYKDYDRLYMLMTDVDSNVTINGLIVKQKDNQYIYVSKIVFDSYIVNEKDLIALELYKDDKLVSYGNKLYDLIIPINSIENFDNMYIKIEIKTLNNKNYNFEIPLGYSNFDEKDYLMNYDFNGNINKIEQELLNMDFKNIDDSYYEYNKNTKNTKTKIKVYLDLKQIMYNYEDKTTVKIITYNYLLDSLDVYIYQVKDNTNILNEKYIYYYQKDSLKCENGLCASKKKILELMETYRSLLFVE